MLGIFISIGWKQGHTLRICVHIHVMDFITPELELLFFVRKGGRHKVNALVVQLPVLVAT